MADHLTVDIDSDEGDYTDYATDAPLPTPSGTPYRTPHPSRHPSRGATPSPTPSPYPVSSSPPTTNGRASPLHRMNIGHQQHHHLHHQDRSFDESISILDPRRFTPTLHANLVAEILSLRRELESKSNLVDTLEQDLHAARNEHETAASSAVTAQREARDVKRQLARAENDDAVEAVAKERDGAVNAVAELKRQVERLTKSRRSAEDDFDRIKRMAEDDHDQHEASKRLLERRAHVAEGRLKSLLDELAAANAIPPPPPVQDTPETDHEDAASDTGSIKGSIRDSSRDSFRGLRASLMMGDDEAERLGIRFSVVAGSKGPSLADELNFDEEDEDDLEGDDEDEDDRTEAEFSFADDNASEGFAGDNISDSGPESEAGGDDEECEMTEYHEMGVQVDFGDDEIEEDQEQEHQRHHESEQQSERLDVLGLEIEEKLAELERTYAELDRKTIELDSIYSEFDRVHDRVAELEVQIVRMEEEADDRDEIFTDMRNDHAQLKNDHIQLKIDHARLKGDHTQLESNHVEQTKLLIAKGKDVEERWTTLQTQEAILQTQQISLDNVEKTLHKRLKELDEREKYLKGREELIIAASTPIDIDGEEHADKDLTLADIEAKEREGEYEANERRKRSRSMGVSSPTPYSPVVTSPVVTFPTYVSSESQTRPVYTSVESQTSPAYISVESQTSPAYISVESQTSSAYVSTESQTNPPYVSVEAQTSPPYVSIEAQVAPVYVSIEAQVTPIYVSIESQTDETPPPPPPPPPPRTPTPPPVIEMQTVGVQTDPMRPPPLPRIIPTISVIPPPLTPPLPKPIMRNAAVQTRSMPRAKSRSVQTEEIRLDQKILRLPPHLHPSAIMANNPLPPVPKPIDPIPSDDAPPPTPPKKNARRSMAKRTSAMGPTSVPATAPRSMPPVDEPLGSAIIYGSPPRVSLYDDTPEKDKDNIRRHLFNGVDFSHDLPQSSGDDEFHDDPDLSGNEFKTALSAPKPKKSRNNPHINLSRPSPVEVSSQKSVGSLQRKGATIRKNALISSGTQAHNRVRSPSLTSNIASESGGTKIGPPFPVPARHSSRKPSGYGNHSRVESPTPMPVGLPRSNLSSRHQRQPSVQSIQSIRKVRSATALPTLRTTNPRNRSPPPLSASSAAPDSPGLPPPLPRDEVISPGFDKQKFGASRNKYQDNANTSNSANTIGNASHASSLIQQTSVVDAIAQTMVGEWMWKYVRRRKSFGVSESPQNPDGRDESGGGQRHKRWVWLAPYERAVMWSSRQPTSGNALLGKSGRKRKRSILQPPNGLSRALDKVLTRKVPIQSVLDVKDDTPLPKGADPSKPLFNRSILILTPARALKFTAPNRERHYVWLTALSFLSHSPQGSEGLLALPPPMPFEYEQVHQQALAPPVQRPPMPPIPVHRDAPFHPVRDSIRLAKGKSRQSRQKHTGFPPPRKDSIREVESIMSNGSVAEPPSIPRFPGQHARKRSNSAVRPGTQRSISNEYHRNGYDPSVLSSYGGSSQGDYYGNGIVGGIGLVSGNSSMLNGHSGPPMGGWEAGPMGTVRMEAFVERQPRYEFDEEDEYRRPSSYRLRRDRRSSRQESYWSGSGDFYAGSGPGPADGEGFWRGDDPFGGF